MFYDPNGPWHDPPREPRPQRPVRRAPELSPRQAKTLGWLVIVNLAMLLLGPLAGSSVINALAAFFHH